MSKYLYNNSLRSYMFVCMLAIAGQTAEPNGLTFFQRPMGIPGVTKASKIQFFLNYTPAT